MRYFQEIEAPNHMWIAEAAYWIAFGVIPAFELSQQSRDYDLEVRECVDTVLDSEGQLFDLNLNCSESFLARVFPEIDAKKYIEKLDVCGGQLPEELQKDLSKYRLRMEEQESKNSPDETNEELKKYYEDLSAEYAEKLVAAEELRRLQVPLRVKLRQAQGKLFSALIEGKIFAKGVKMPLESSVVFEWSEDDFPTEFSDIPSSSWDAQKIDWNSSNLDTWDCKYLAAILETKDVFSMYPRPELPATEFVAELVGEALIVNENDENLPSMAFTKRRRGAPTKDDRILLKAIFKHMDEQKQSGSLASKKEAQIAEIGSFVRDRLEEDLPRSTAQRYLEKWIEQ